MYELLLLDTNHYCCYSTQNPRMGTISADIVYVTDRSKFTYGAGSWDEWASWHDVQQTITFDSIEQLKSDYSELFI